MPVYFVTFGDAVTGDNEYLGTDGKRRWDVDAGADQYQNEVYERPTIQSYDTNSGRFSAQEYFQNLDIVEARVGFDAQYLYVAVDLFGRDKSDQGGDTEEGLVYEYAVRLAFDPDGRYGILLRADQPELKNGTTFGLLGNLGMVDTDGDVGGRGGPLHGNPGPTGLSVTKQDNPLEESGGSSGSLNGYDDDVIADGLFGATPVLWSRVDPNDDTVVEFAWDYTAFGFEASDFAFVPYLDMQAVKGDPQDPKNYFWNDKYNKLEAGSPYDLAEFGGNGLGSIYELDTVRDGGVIPEPGTAFLLALGLVGLGLRGRRS
jgi:hypothetical protein